MSTPGIPSVRLASTTASAAAYTGATSDRAPTKRTLERRVAGRLRLERGAPGPWPATTRCTPWRRPTAAIASSTRFSSVSEPM